MVTDLSQYFRSYTGARVEPPSFIITADDLPSYVHIPFGKQADRVKSINWRTSSESARGPSILNGSDMPPERVTILRTRELPVREQKLDENVAARLAMLASEKERSFELLYQEGEMSVLLSSKGQEDLLMYRDLMESVYGEIKFEGITDPRPEFLRELPMILIL